MPLYLERVRRVLASLLLFVAGCSTAPDGVDPTATTASTMSSTSVSSAPPSTMVSDLPVDNLAAFARLTNYVRFFHPSDEAANADWAEFLVTFAPIVESADGPQALSSVLADAFGTVAPSVSVFVSGESSGDRQGPEGMDGDAVTAWFHRGVGNVEIPQVHAPYGSERVVVRNDEEPPSGSLTHRTRLKSTSVLGCRL